MFDQTELERLHRQVEKARTLVRQSEMKVHDLEASVREIYNFTERLVLFPRNGKRKVPACANAAS